MGASSAEFAGFEVLASTGGNLVAVRAGGAAIGQDYERLYAWLAEETERHGAVRVYEEIPGWTGPIFRSHVRYGTFADLSYGPEITISSYAVVGDSGWARLMYRLWFLIKPVWPLAPLRMRYFDWPERGRALAWLLEDEEQDGR
ncbi:SpoIIAA family protein [Salinactinospora qingdaonensis]|uniref:SpoIIAA-like n=1 Tax=Salinactinospora qingdaonensis TaxID=702744 RepID=A0ABP7F519_9ACTN